MGDSIMIIAGESSGDLHGAELVKSLLRRSPQLNVYGIGGDRMRQAGVKLNYHINNFSFLGFVEVIKHLSFIKKAQSKLLEFIAERKIKLVVLIDYPGFNLNFAKKLKKLKVKIVYYISPQVWAWGEGRVKRIKKYVNEMLVVFPFEEKFYSERNVKATYVGHPLIERLNNFNFLSKEEFFDKYGLTKEKEIIAIFPGSRKDEAIKILPPVFEGAQMLARKFNLQIVIAVADTIEVDWLKSIVNIEEAKVVKSDSYNLMKRSAFGIIKSGTSTLEAALIELPMVVVYKTNYLTYLIGKSLVKLKTISMPNILARKKIVPELIQNELTGENVFKTVSAYFNERDKLSALKNELRKIKEIFGNKSSASEESAKIIMDLLNA